MEDSVNKDLYDRTVDHSAMTRMFEDKMQVDTKRFIRKHRRELEKIVASPDFKKAFENNDFKSMNVMASREVRRFIAELDSGSLTALKELGLVELDFTTNNLHKALSPYAIIRKPGAAKVLSEIVGTNIQGNGNLTRRVHALGASELTRIQKTIRQGLREGWDNKTLVTAVKRATRLTESQASALVRTAVTNTQTQAQLASFQENKAVLKGMRFTAVLDNRTSQICAHHDGTVFDVDDIRFAPPLHWRCRSTLVPVAKSFDELLNSVSPDVKRKTLVNLRESGIKRLDGSPPTRESYGDWLKRQPRETKVRHFQGDLQKVDLFDNGQLPLKVLLQQVGNLFLSLL